MVIKDLYLRDKSDPKFKSNRIEITSELQLVLNQIRMILLTNKGEVLGDYEFGLDLQKYLFEFHLDEEKIKQDFLTQVSKYITNTGYDINIEVEFEVPTDGSSNSTWLYVSVNQQRMIGITL